MKRLFKSYRDLLGIVYSEAPVMVVTTFVVSIILGAIVPVSIRVNQHIFDDGLAIASGKMSFNAYVPYIVLFIIISLLPGVLDGIYIYGYAEKRSLLILRSAYRSRMLQKCKTMKYEHFESSESMEIIDKAYNRAENSARHMFPMYVSWTLSSIVASIGTIYFIVSVKWWLLLTILIPFVVETIIQTKKNYNVYDELEKYWNKERQYNIVAGYLRSRDYVRELKLFNAASYLIKTYKDRLHNRNREYERYYFKHLKQNILGYNITKIATLANVIIMLLLFVNGSMTAGLFIALTSQMLNGIYRSFNGSTIFFRVSGYHINFFEYFHKYFELSDENRGTESEMPQRFDIEFKDVWFRYPNTDRYILKGLNMRINQGERTSIVGKNGEGKSTIVKLLLGLFIPDRGEILINGKNIGEYPLSIRTKIFAPVFQDFVKYSLTLRENIGIGDVENINDDAKIKRASAKGRVDRFLDNLPNGYDTLLNRDFEGGVDISGGQWQRIVIARAFMGDKPVLLLDEPTSQLDPVAESQLYSEFADMVENKTALFITHRLASTMITDRIFVIKDGVIEEQGTHDELMRLKGIYHTMFEAQKQWYQRSEAGA